MLVRARVGHPPAVAMVSILTRPEGRVLAAVLHDVIHTHHRVVSILTRPEGRVLAGAGGRQRSTSPGFNPHPPRGAGAGREIPPGQQRGAVSILTRPEGRVLGCPEVLGWPVSIRVSILTRPEGRVLDLGDPEFGRRVVGVSILTRPEGRVLAACP